MQIQQKLIEACKGLGLNLLEISEFVQLSEMPEIACWGFDLRKKRNYIFVNPKVLKLSVERVRLILKHEILHYAGYKNLEYAKDFPKANIAYDIVINKILTLAHQRDMKALCKRIYPAETKNNILVLCRPDVHPDQIKIHKRLWLSIWSKMEIPSPASVYYRIALPAKIACSPFVVHVSVSRDIVFRRIPESMTDTRFNDFTSKVVDIVKKTFSDNGYSATQFSAMFRKIFIHKCSFDSSSVTEFISRIESRQTLENACMKIVSALDNRSSCQLYPYQLSRIGIIYVACGVSNRVPIYWNKTPESKKSRLAIYIDTSPSMEPYQEKEVFLIDKLKSYFPTRVYCFANNVKEISLDDFANGNYEEGYSTSFDAVIEHMLSSKYDAGVVFTDGFSYVNPTNAQRFKQSGKRMFTIYFSDNGEVESELDKICEQTMTIKAN
jgi:hypothetical protein